MIRVFKIDTPLSLSQLYEKYGLGKEGFLPKSCWILHTELARLVPDPGIYQINFNIDSFIEMNHKEQNNSLSKDEMFPHTALLSQVLLEHYHKTGERLLELMWSRTSLKYMGCYICVRFTPWGLYICDDYIDSFVDSIRYKRMGMSVTKKIK